MPRKNTPTEKIPGSRKAAILVSLAIALFLPASAQDSGPTQADWDWVNEHYLRALDELLPMKVPNGIYVSYRSHRDLYTETFEYSFFIGRGPNEHGPGLNKFLSAHVRVADSVSIYDQMMALHRNNPAESADSIKKKIKVKTSDLSEKACPAIQSQFLKFQNLSFRPPEFESIVIHPLIHDFHVSAGMGDMDLYLVDDEHPLVLWAIETRKTLDSCIAASSSSRPAS